MPLAPQVFYPPVEPGPGRAGRHRQQPAFGNNLYQVLLTVTCATAKLGEDVGFLAEVHQAGIFQITGFAEAELPALLSAYCPNLVFPFAREAVAELVQRAGFPPLLLQPINFDALFAEHVGRARKDAAVEKANDGGARLQ